MNPERLPDHFIPSSLQVRAALARLADSEEFRASPQLNAFLTFVVEAVLSGNAGVIKAYTIGVEALGRGTDFDPQIDPIVRVEATRLRRTMARYYAGSGATEAVIIELPRGSYVPSFRLRPTAPPETRPKADPENAGSKPRPHRLRVLPPVVAIIIAIGFFAPKIRMEWPTNPSATAALPVVAETVTSLLRPGNGLPTLALSAFDVIGSPHPRGISAASLHDVLSDAFARFDLVNVIADPIENGAKPARPAASSRAAEDYRLFGRIEYYEHDEVRVRFRLIDRADGSVIWARVFDARSDGGDSRAAEEAIVRELSTTLVQPFGVIYAHGRRLTSSGTGDPRYRCVLESIESLRWFDSSLTASARSCLERLTFQDPTFALGWTYLAGIYLQEYQFGSASQSNDEPPLLDRALRAAQCGVELNPVGARAYEILFEVLFARGDLAGAFAAGDTAVSLNRYDTLATGTYATRKIAAGDIDQGMEILRRATVDGAMTPAIGRFFMFVRDYMKGEIASAAFDADQLTSDTFQLRHVARALVSRAKGDGETARRSIDRLIVLNPAWRRDLHGQLAKIFYAQDIIRRFADDLAAAGLSNLN